MGFSLIMIGLLFLLGPDISMIDILPDFVGHILILKGLSSLAKINSDFSEASKYFKWCLCVSVIKIPLYVMALAMSKSDMFITLLFVFSSGLLDAIFAYNAFSAFFNGLSSSSLSDENDQNYRCAVFCNFEKIRKFTLVFAVLKPMLYIAPELTRLDNSDYGEVTVNGVASLYRFYNVFVVISALIALIVGIVWYVKIRAYIKGVIADRRYIASLEDNYTTNFKNDKLKYESFGILRTLSLLTVAFVFLFKFQLDGISYIPPFIFPVLVYISAIFMKNVVKSDLKKLKLFSLISAVVNLIYWVYNILFVNSFIVIDNSSYGMTLSFAEQLDVMINSDFDTLYGFIGLCVISFITAVIGIILVKYLFDAILYIAKTHAFTNFGKKPDILSSSSDIFESERNASTETLFKVTKIFAYIVVAFEFISTALVTLYPKFIRNVVTSLPDSLKALRTILSNVSPSLWSIDMLLRIVLIICACVLITRIRDGYKTKNYIE